MKILTRRRLTNLFVGGKCVKLGCSDKLEKQQDISLGPSPILTLLLAVGAKHMACVNNQHA